MGSSKYNFENTEIAFRQKSDKELKRAYWLFKLLASPVLTKLGATFTNLALKLRLPVKGIIRNTIYVQFCGGENLEKSIPSIEGLARGKALTVLDYGVEAKNNEADFDRTMEEMFREIKFASTNPNIPYVSCKLTGLFRFELLEKLQNKETLSEEEKQEHERALNRIDRIASLAHEHDVELYIDAEETWIQDPVDELTDNLMEKYNREKVIVSNTVQLYRTDRLQYLRDAFARSVERGYYYGIKLVRGAYMEKERERAIKMGYTSPIHQTKEDTDRDFDDAIRFCIENNDRIAVCVATHNENSCKLMADLIEEKKIDPQNPHIVCCQLYGMSDHITFNLANAGFRAGKYIPYGPVKDVLPYLIRRAEENTSVEGQTTRELQLIHKEILRRKLG
jgi:proline dehydrogenase